MRLKDAQKLFKDTLFKTSMIIDWNESVEVLIQRDRDGAALRAVQGETVMMFVKNSHAAQSKEENRTPQKKSTSVLFFTIQLR